jgi:hypothetical protein
VAFAAARTDIGTRHRLIVSGANPYRLLAGGEGRGGKSSGWGERDCKPQQSVEVSRAVSESFDFVIVGAGSAGCTLADDLPRTVPGMCCCLRRAPRMTESASGCPPSTRGCATQPPIGTTTRLKANGLDKRITGHGGKFSAARRRPTQCPTSAAIQLITTGGATSTEQPGGGSTMYCPTSSGLSATRASQDRCTAVSGLYTLRTGSSCMNSPVLGCNPRSPRAWPRQRTTSTGNPSWASAPIKSPAIRGTAGRPLMHTYDLP